MMQLIKNISASLILAFLISIQIHSQTINTFAGIGTIGYSGDNGPALNSQFSYPYGIDVDSIGNIYVADNGNNCIRKIDTAGIITTVAGIGSLGYSGDNGLATSAQLYYPYDVAVDSKGNIFICDYANNRIRKVDTAGIITTVAGNGNPGFSGDGGLATNAKLDRPLSVDVDHQGNIYISDGYNLRIRKVDTLGIITTFAGNGIYGFAGDGGPADSASFRYTYSMAFDAAGNCYVSDGGNNRVRKIDTNNIITTFAGGGVGSYSGDGGQADSAGMYSPMGISFDAAGNLFIVEHNNHIVRKVDTAGIISTYAGTGNGGFAGDGGPASLARFSQPFGIAINSANTIFISDMNNQRIRKIDTTSVMTAISLNNFISPVQLYPIPNNGTMTFQTQFEQSYLQIFNVFGEIIYQDALDYPAKQIKIEGPAGIYFYRITTSKNSVYTGKFTRE